MTPRTRAIPDSVILEQACQLLAEQGRDAMTFAQVAQRCGLAPPTLVQRFATRNGMLQAVAGALRAQLTAALAVPNVSPIPRLHAGLQQAAPLMTAAMSLEPAAGTGQFCLELRKQISYGLAAAVEAGELPHCDVAQLARTIQISVIGAVAIARLEGGDVAMEITHALDTQLATYI